MTDDIAELQRQIAELQRQIAGQPAGPALSGPVSGARDVNIATNQWITVLGAQIYHAAPDTGQEAQIAQYLQRLAARWQLLPLRGLDEQINQGQAIGLAAVYVELASATSRTLIDSGPATTLRSYFQGDDPRNDVKREYGTHWALPSQAIREILQALPEHAAADLPDLRLLRATLITEAAHTHPRLVLLSDPGGGKSTFVRHLAGALARRALGQPDTTPLRGWPDDARVLPLLLPLPALAARIAADGAHPATVAAALSAELAREYAIHAADTLVAHALYSPAVLLLLDGLDEVPVAASALSADRLTTVRLVRAFAQLAPQARVLLTCRAGAFDDTLRAELGWAAELIAPFTLGQIRHFAGTWFGELAQRGQLADGQAVPLAAHLITTIANSPTLQAMAETPLLLTIMALILFNQGVLPRDRPHLYERLLALLLGQWDALRAGAGMAETLGLPGWGSERLQPLLDRLSYAAHAGARGADGRGRLERGALYLALRDFFRQAQVARPGDAADRCLAYLEDRSGLLVPDASGGYQFAHLTIQEHCAGRYLVLSRNAAEQIMSHRADDHWREPILLGLGVVQSTNPWLIESVLHRLISRTGKDDARWQRDLIFAAEIGADRDWVVLAEQGADVPALQAGLRAGLVALLADAAQPLPIAERVRAGLLLGDLGDPRVPTTLAEWRRALARAAAGASDGYLCRIPLAADSETLWIGRYPITNAQLRVWEQLEGSPARRILDPQADRANLPAAGISWHTASAFCAWLGEQLGATVRLPSDAEWSAAAGGLDGRLYPWGSQRARDRAAIKEDQALRAWPYPTPVGCYPAGAAPCGALDLAGNVWEWVADRWQPDGPAEKAARGQERRVLRGGGHVAKKSQILISARLGLPPGATYENGFRIVVGLKLREE